MSLGLHMAYTHDAGEMREGQRHGFGVLEVFQGGRYTGMLAFGQKHGYVICVCMGMEH
jgi:hypothetical protein